MSKLFVCLTAASTLALSGAAYAQSTSPTPAKKPATPPAASTTTPATPSTGATPADPAEGMAATPANPATPATPGATPPAAQEAPMAPGAQAQAGAQPGAAAGTATASAPAAAPVSVATGMTLKDNTGATVGTITDLKADASGSNMATVKMGESSFTVAASSLAVQNGAAVINLTQAQLQAMVTKPKS